MKSIEDFQPLHQLKPGVSGRIVELKATGPLLQRLLAMGFIRGSEVTLVRKAPLQDPIQFKLKGSSVSLRKTDAELVLVTLS
ncbi:MAG TPA: ferrous iron transport protein A [Chloroflexia bacterium]|nr:ferrous iron transport protein A [Chloroflexia bacterium]